MKFIKHTNKVLNKFYKDKFSHDDLSYYKLIFYHVYEKIKLSDMKYFPYEYTPMTTTNMNKILNMFKTINSFKKL